MAKSSGAGDRAGFIGRRRHERVPLFVRTQLVEDTRTLSGYTTDIGVGGMRLRLASSVSRKAPELSVGSRARVGFSLPDRTSVSSLGVTVAWVGGITRDPRGHRALDVGLRFDDGQPAEVAVVREFVEAFRYRILAYDLTDLQAVTVALGDGYAITTDREAGGGLVGAIVVGEARGSARGVSHLRSILDDPTVEAEPPIIYLTAEPTDELDRLVSQSDRIIVQVLPVGPLQLRSVVRRCLEGHTLSLDNERLRSELTATLQRVQRENEYYRGRLRARTRPAGMIGASAPMERVYALLERVAPVDTGVLITGETGAGKDLIARAIHEGSRRRDGPFVAQSCAALPDTLLDSELFGHRRGAFTGATDNRAGLFEAATGGTIFLDEIGETSPAMQAKLLQVLQNGLIRRVGDVTPTQTDVRVLCATHRDLAEAVATGTFREDLYYRISAFVIHLPPLRERLDDLPALAGHFLERFAVKNQTPEAALAPEALRLLMRYRWPGNVRQLQAVVERMAILAAPATSIQTTVVRQALGLEVEMHGQPQIQVEQNLDELVRDFERDLVQAMLIECKGVITEAARRLGVERSTLSRRCRRLGIAPSSQS